MPQIRDPRVFVYAGFDLAFAALHAVLLFGIIPNRHGWVQALAVLLVASCAVMGVSMLVRRSWSWWLGIAACTALLLVAATFLVLTVLSAALLAGVYGSFGQAGAMITLVGAALVVELVALLPAFQLKFLLTRAGRRCFGKESLPA